jgi:hypothetical protein
MTAAHTRAFYAWLIQPVANQCPKWVRATALVAALLTTYALLAWDFVCYFFTTGKEGIYELNDHLAAMAVRLTCTPTDVEYYQRQAAHAKQLYENTLRYGAVAAHLADDLRKEVTELTQEGIEDFCDFTDEVPATDCWTEPTKEQLDEAFTSGDPSDDYWQAREAELKNWMEELDHVLGSTELTVEDLKEMVESGELGVHTTARSERIHELVKDVVLEEADEVVPAADCWTEPNPWFAGDRPVKLNRAARRKARKS